MNILSDFLLMLKISPFYSDVFHHGAHLDSRATELKAYCKKEDTKFLLTFMETCEVQTLAAGRKNLHPMTNQRGQYAWRHNDGYLKVKIPHVVFYKFIKGAPFLTGTVGKFGKYRRRP